MTTMTITFECGVTVTGVAMPGLAIRAHLGQCEVQACQAELAQAAEQYRNVLID
jgi:hypothetical protein